MRRPIVAGNWKMHGSRAENARLVEELVGAAIRAEPAADCVVCPPFVYLQEVGRLLRGLARSASARRTSARTRRAPSPARCRRRC